jgi:hypothetical protein
MLLRGDMDGLKCALGHTVTEGRHGWPEMSPRLFLRGSRCASFSLRPRLSVRDEEPYPT